MKIIVLEGYTTNPGDLSWEGLNELGDVTIYDRTSLTNEQEIIDRIGDAEIVLTNKAPLTKKVITACSSLKYIGVLATGYNVVDMKTAQEKNIVVTNVPDYSTQSVAQMTVALLLEICQQVGHHNQAVHEGKWEEHPDWTFFDYPLIELSGKTIGIIGFGSIGQATAKIAQAMGMEVLAYNRSQSEEGKKLATYVELDELLEKSDVISLHIPLVEETNALINEETIFKMKDRVILLNTARGGLLDEEAVAEALNKGKMYAAGVDVVSTESIESTNPLLKAKNVFITPHIAWATKESRTRLIEIAVNNVRQFIEGKPKNVVSK
ncbi:D-2-hydroxyacid dehydrogenase [Desemzia sp. RIT804]|uniref:D-2-hydroxyacid dehydrogenase n=1 Tax=Desemzia sp. RIT 804 TaxID=2810209 RepID=UPI001950A0E7|nr:D-2-hydroxyacid dehydrogenase [Desemzia sp. RIT 804]MBM6614351.1 D-2-hydroxyacid dehydrogenase [Desemzia sp. RIT 804]